MTDPTQPVEHTVRFGSRQGAALRTGLVVAVALILVAVITAPGARPDRSTDPLGLAAGASASAASPAASGDSDRGKADRIPGIGRGWGLFERGTKAGGRGITITAISGARVSLETVDGWTRTVQVTADTIIRKGGVATKVGDLKVGDVIRLKQRRNDDGTFTVVGLTVPVPVVAGEVTAVTSDRLTIKQRDGSSQTIYVDKDTVFRIRKTDTPTIADVKVGDRVGAAGPLRADGSMDAVAVQVKRKLARDGERVPDGLRSPKPSNAPST
ncbi:MAG: DUF5666 domain-containing protein [Candidatus Limnocylindrales bacterium]